MPGSGWPGDWEDHPPNHRSWSELSGPVRGVRRSIRYLLQDHFPVERKEEIWEAWQKKNESLSRRDCPHCGFDVPVSY